MIVILNILAVIFWVMIFLLYLFREKKSVKSRAQINKDHDQIIRELQERKRQQALQWQRFWKWAKYILMPFYIIIAIALALIGVPAPRRNHC